MNDTTGITINDEPGQVRVTIPGTYGAIMFRLGGDDAEHVPAEGVFTYRGRVYPGKIILKRADFSPAPGYGWMLRNDRGVPASTAAHKAIAGQAGRDILAALEAHPVILSSARHADHSRRLADAVRLVDSLTEQLAAARAAESAIRNGPPRTWHPVEVRRPVVKPQNAGRDRASWDQDDAAQEALYQITADGSAWEDSDGRDTWPESEARALAEDLERRRGYTVTLHEV